MEVPVSVYTNFEIRATIRFLTARGETAIKIYRQLCETYGEGCLDISRVRRWRRQFIEGRTSVDDEARSGRPSDSVTDAHIERVRQLLKEDSRLTLSELRSKMPIDCGRTSIRTIVYDKLRYRKLSARWVPKLLTDVHKNQRQGAALEFLSRYEAEGVDLLERIVTGDETWVYHYTPEQKIQSMQWCAPGEPAPKKAKTERVTAKIMATVFWDSHGILLIRYMPRKSTINSTAYCEVLRALRHEIGRKRPNLPQDQVILLHDNARPHTAQATQNQLKKFGWSIMTHPPYSPDLAPSDFHLFPALKRHLGGRRFTSDEEVKIAVRNFFKSCTKEWFAQGIERLVSRYDKCLNNSGNYVEK
ncbi:hypothetical protein V9T40_011817 [Parthenolecanium corni]|uniref:Mos1 transposase HTH domain-containing protein n=1 Tax=Parthenolecanium corni TaxID=536013 RepID=A0AAN9T7R8_9HEMI